MNFTAEIKRELISKGLRDEGRIPALSAFLKTSGDVFVREGKPSFYFVSERERVAEFFMSVFLEIFGVELFVSHATFDKLSGRDKLVMQCPADKAEEVVKALGFVKKTGELREGIYAKLLQNDEAKIAYIRGAFLGGGSCTVPTDGGKTGYHLEFVFPDKKTAKGFCRLLAEFELIAKVAERKESYVAYIKSKELISDFLSIVEAENALKNFSTLVERRDKANNDNRARNCIAGNADKSATAAVKQVVAIQKLQREGKLSDLSEELQTLALLRLKSPACSLQELAVALGVSKSCLNHRMRKLMEIAASVNR